MEPLISHDRLSSGNDVPVPRPANIQCQLRLVALGYALTSILIVYVNTVEIESIHCYAMLGEHRMMTCKATIPAGHHLLQA